MNANYLMALKQQQETEKDLEELKKKRKFFKEKLDSLLSSKFDVVLLPDRYSTFLNEIQQKELHGNEQFTELSSQLTDGFSLVF